MRKYKSRAIIALAVIVVLGVLPKAFNMSVANNCDKCGNASTDFFFVGRDLTTQGDWIASRYGDCGYALPYANVTGKEVAIGETTGVGESAHEYWWREPWSVLGPKYYSYDDYLGGLNILEYNITGSEGPPRALVDSDTDYYRPSWYCHDSSITVTLNGVTGNYKLSIYLLDWDAPTLGRCRKLNVTVTSGSVSDWHVVGDSFTENFAAGTYAIFEVNSGGSIEIQVETLTLRSAVISGIFLDEISGPVAGVNFAGLDPDTKGNWRPLYGNSHYLLAGFNVPSSNVGYIPIVKSYDETDIDPGNYEVSGGVCQYAADDARTYGTYPYIGQYAAYEWGLPSNVTASDPRVLIYPQDKIYHGYPPTPLNGRLYGQWDSGEMNAILNYFIMRLKIPRGEYILSIYAMDFAQSGRSENITIWDESVTNLLDFQHITSSEINNGIYIQWFVEGPRIINIKVTADPGNLNSFIDGIFLNCMGYCGETPGFWKNNIRKALEGQTWGIQVSKQSILNALDMITVSYGTGTMWNYGWLTFLGSDNDKLSEAWDMLDYEGNDMEAKARKQILALLLTATHYGGSLDMILIGWYDGGQTKTLVGWITTILNEYNNENYEVAKDLADFLNNIGCT